MCVCVSQKKRQKPSGAYSYQTPQTMKIAIIIMCVSCESLCVYRGGRWHFLFIQKFLLSSLYDHISNVLLSLYSPILHMTLLIFLLCFTLAYIIISLYFPGLIIFPAKSNYNHDHADTDDTVKTKMQKGFFSALLFFHSSSSHSLQEFSQLVKWFFIVA